MILLLYIALSIALLLFLVLGLRLHAFIALLLSSIFLGLITGAEPMQIVDSIQEGMGSTLGYVATIVGIGAIFGQILEISGGTEVIASTLLRRFGTAKAPYGLAIAGFLIAIPVFFDVGFILLVPILRILAHDTRQSIIRFAVPLLAGLAVTHAFIPPTPGPVAVAKLLGADIGLVTLWGFVVGIPVTIVAGPLFGNWIATKIHPQSDETVETVSRNIGHTVPSFALVVSVILSPLILMMTGSILSMLAKEGAGIPPSIVSFFAFAGHPFIALLLCTVAAVWLLGRRNGISLPVIQKMCDKALAPAGMVVLVTGAGGVFKQMLVSTHLGEALGTMISTSGMPLLVVAFLFAALVRVSLGSGTVSMITSAGFIAPMLDVVPVSDLNRALLVIVIASGATVLSHVNDSGFWLVGKYLHLSESQTLRVWTTMETIIGLTGFALCMVISVCLG